MLQISSALNDVWFPLVIEEAIEVACRSHALDIGEKRLHLWKSENGVTWLDVAIATCVGGSTRDAINRGIATNSAESVGGVELSHRARPLVVVILRTVIQQLYECGMLI